MGIKYNAKGSLSFEKGRFSADESLEYCYFCESYVHFHEFAMHLKSCIPVFKEIHEHIPIPVDSWPRKKRQYLEELCVIFDAFLYIIGLKSSYDNSIELNDDMWITIRNAYVHLYNIRSGECIENITLPIIERMCESQREALFNIKVPLIADFKKHFENCGFEIAIFNYRQHFDEFELGQNINEELPPINMRSWPMRAYFRRNHALNMQRPSMLQYLYHFT